MTGTDRTKVDDSIRGIEEFFNTEVIRGERIVGWTRLILGIAGLLSVVLLEHIPLTEGATVDAELTAGGCLVAVIYSLWTIGTLKETTRRTELRLFGSVAVDALLIAMVTGGDIVSPDPDYLGLLREPAIGLFFLAAMGAGVRLSGRVAVAGSIVLVVVGSTMIVTDMQLHPSFVSYHFEEIALWLIVLLGSTLLGYTGATRTRNLVFRGASFAVDAERTRQRFGVYVSEEVASQVLKDGDLQVSGRRQHVAVLFCDLRGFTKYAESTPPEQLVGELNAYLDVMLAEVRKEGGWLDKYIGDAMMVVFGIGGSRHDDAARAIRAAAAMRKALVTHNAERRSKGRPPFEHGIGIHHGSAIVGNIGTSERLQYTVVGDVVNLASRIEAATKELKEPVLISSVAAHVARSAGPGKVPLLREVGSQTFPGRTNAIELYTLDT